MYPGFFEEFLVTYLLGLVAYPVYLVSWAIELPLLFIAWAATAIVVFFLIKKFRLSLLTKPMVVIWFMPGTIICGAATSIPWPFAVRSYFAYEGCTPIPALSLALILNVAIVYIFIYTVNIIRERRVSNA